MRLFLSILFVLCMTIPGAFAAGTCDQVFDGWMLRYNASYNFFDTWNNTTKKTQYLNTYSVDFVNWQYFDKGDAFNWTQALKDNNYAVNPNSSLKVLQTWNRKRKIDQHPTIRTQGTRDSYDFGIEYTIGFDTSNNYPNASDDVSHKECIYYSVTWCGDGILDTGYETCDPNDPNRVGFWALGCNAQCQPVNIPGNNPTCQWLTYSRNNNVFNFTCTSTPSPSSQYTLYDANNNVLAQNTTGIFQNITLTDTNVDNISCRVAGETVARPACILSDVISRMACSSLSVDLPTGSGSKIFTSTGTSQGTIINRHILGSTLLVGDSWVQTADTPVWVFSGVLAQENNQFRSTVFDPLGNSATSDACLLSIGPSWDCISLTWSPTSSTNGTLTTSLTCTGTWGLVTTSWSVLTYLLEIFDLSNNSVVQSWTASTLSATLSTGNYSATCRVNWQQTASLACTLPLSATTSTSSSSWWGSSSSWWGSSSSSSWGGGWFCGDGIVSSGEMCDPWVLMWSPFYNPSCRSNCTYCGDGRLDKPYSSTWEQCDSNEPWCSDTCKITDSTFPGGTTLDPNRTKPGGGVVDIFPQGDLLIWDNMSVFWSLSSGNRAAVQNVANSEIYVPGLCMKTQTNTVFNKSINTCFWQVGYLSPGQTKSFSLSSLDLKGDTSRLWSATFWDAKIITKIEWVSDTSFLNAILNVRVAKSSINTAWWGAWLLNGVSLSDVNELSTKGTMPFGPLSPALNKNLILTSLWVNPLSSNVDKKVTNPSFINKSKWEVQNDLKTLSNVKKSWSDTSLDKLPYEKFNGMDNVFIHKWNVDLENSNITKNATYIIEGNLNINRNISTQKNVLFVVKWGNITISKDVTNINAILIVIWDGKILWDQKTSNILTINGALYGNISDLLEKRTYVKGNGSYVNVGTNVNFSSKIFTSPPPLLSKFLSEYVESNKTAQ